MRSWGPDDLVEAVVRELAYSAIHSVAGAVWVLPTSNKTDPGAVKPSPACSQPARAGIPSLRQLRLRAADRLTALSNRPVCRCFTHIRLETGLPYPVSSPGGALALSLQSSACRCHPSLVARASCSAVENYACEDRCCSRRVLSLAAKSP